jgi:ABC-2 type transport system permease protein
MSWGLEGFLDIFLRNGNVSDVLPESLSLLIFGAVMLTWTIIALKKQREV